MIIVSGWACELRILPDGRRQIFSFFLPGDVIDVASMSNVGTRGVIALTRLEVVNTSPLLANEGVQRDSVLKALKAAALQKEDRLYDQMVRMGRLSARERVLHLLLELCERLEGVRLVKGDTFRLPLTQEVFADALGLSVVHINRTLQQLRREGAVQLKAGSVTLYNRTKLAALSCYQSQAASPPGEISPVDSINLMIQPVSTPARHSAA